jgi:hypothetical protein
MKAVLEIITAVTLLVGGAKIGQSFLQEVRKEALMKVHKDPPSLGSFTRKLIHQKDSFYW